MDDLDDMFRRLEKDLDKMIGSEILERRTARIGEPGMIPRRRTERERMEELGATGSCMVIDDGSLEVVLF